VLVLLYADGTMSETKGPVFKSEQECERYGMAWSAQVNRRLENAVALARCKERDPELRRATP
jgi:hypothetical protein